MYKTPERKLRWFKLRIVYRITPTNTYLFMCNIENSAVCTHCAVEEDILHLLWECEVAKNFCKNVCNGFNQNTIPSVYIEATEKLVILGR